MDIHDYSQIPDHMMINIKNYVAGKEYIGGFLTAIFSNDLFEAVSRADHINMAIIPVYVAYIQNKVPYNCHGSKEIINNWYENKMHKGESK